MGPIWGRQDPGGPHVGLMNFAIWAILVMASCCASSNHFVKMIAGIQNKGVIKALHQRPSLQWCYTSIKASQSTSDPIVFFFKSLIGLTTKNESSATLQVLFVPRHRQMISVDSPHKGPVTDVTVLCHYIPLFYMDVISYPCPYVADVNSSPPGLNGCHLADGIFRYIFTNENFCIVIKIHWGSFLRVQLTISQHWFR